MRPLSYGQSIPAAPSCASRTAGADDIEVVVTKSNNTTLVFLLPGQALPRDVGSFAGVSWIDSTLAVAMHSKAPGTVFTAVRIA